ncbi:PLP-dependent transferase [Synechococcus sp. RSCCF101]|uniref:trans-sulfuration enzyme family protein n=1 Tax=Synechococcus sp. RSCCF101 TaxID=2511069 RepID=UPI001243B8DE|nr:PLP-dependent aspartate aminotransferase family protein [Synechococcus sp. RSCCF101]QEY30914.1 PLP-dependent transferase [Synechococcus sp. RSCCF101]
MTRPDVDQSPASESGPAPGPATAAIHQGETYSAETGAVTAPLFLSSTFAHGNPGGFDYTRSGNPNFRILEGVLAGLEGARHATVFGSGVSAMTAVLSSLRQGDRVLCEENLYGCTVRLLEQVFARFGVEAEWLDFTAVDWPERFSALTAAAPPALIWLESPTNPLLKVIDLAAVSARARAIGVPVLVDNTFATPLLQQPLALGATLSLASTTKYVNGHSDVLGGVVCSNDPAWQERLRFAQKALGLQPSAFDSWLISRGVKTLSLRLERQCANAAAVAEALAAHPAVAALRYPFRADHPQQALARRQMRQGGAMITATLRAGEDQAYGFCKGLRYFTMAESLGGVESLVCHPATMTHAAVRPEVRRRLGIDAGLVRLSIGAEDSADLIADLQRGLDRLG